MISTTLFATLLASAPLDFAPCRIGTDGGPRLNAECATFEVAENPDQPEGRTIGLRIARLKARTNDPAKEPFVFVAGGPGQSSIDTYPQVANAFEKIRQQRPVLLVDQRGTGASNPLKCPMDTLDPTLTGDTAEDRDAILDWTRQCLNSFDADPRFYTTVDAVRDLEAVRQALGIEQFMLYGISYGTRVAQEYLRRHPGSLKAVVMDGVAPVAEALGTEIATDAQRALDAFIERCTRTPECSDAFPDLADRIETLEARLRDQPVSVTTRHPRTGETETVELDWTGIAFQVRMASYSREGASLLPLQLSRAADGDYAALAAGVLTADEGLAETMATGMHNSVVCSEDVPFYSENAADASEDTYLGRLSIDFLEIACSIWPTRDMPDDIKSPVTSDVPTLLLSGELDPVTPPENAELVVESLSAARHVIAPSQGHGVAWRGCMPDILADFYSTRDLDALETDCIERLEPEPFYIDMNGPTP